MTDPNKKTAKKLPPIDEYSLSPDPETRSAQRAELAYWHLTNAIEDLNCDHPRTTSARAHVIRAHLHLSWACENARKAGRLPDRSVGETSTTIGA